MQKIQSERIRVPLKNLKFGHDAPVHPSNARVTGRLDGVEELAANFFSRGMIEDLIVFDDGVPDTYFVSDGNRSLAALRMVFGDNSSEPIDCKLRPADEAFEDSLAVAVMSRKLHQIDEYEGFARLKEKGKTEEDIARQYGLTAHEVEQVMALGGSLSPNVRDLWRNGLIKADVAKILPMVGDHAAQDALLQRLSQEEDNGGLLNVSAGEIKRELKIDRAGVLVEFVGVSAYVAAGGKVTRDLFGIDHKVSDAKLAKKLADKRLDDECKKLKDAGWSFAVPTDSVRNTRHGYTSLKVDETKASPEEQLELARLHAMLPEDDQWGDRVPFGALTGSQQAAFLRIRELRQAIELRRYTPKLMATAGCFAGIDEHGMLEIEFGKVKPAQKAAAAKEVQSERKEQAKVAAKEAEASGKPAPESKTLSNALKERLEMTLVAATRDAIAAEPLLVNSPLFEILARVTCAQIVADRAWGTPDAIRTKLPSIRQALNAGVFNAAIAKRFDAENYFSSAPKSFVLKAIAEAINPDEARKVSAKTKAEIWKFALANLARTGWLPKELRTVHYAGPGSEGYKPAAAAPPAPAVPKTTAETVKQAKAARADHAAEVQMKRAAAAKKAVKKTSAKTKR